MRQQQHECDRGWYSHTYSGTIRLRYQQPTLSKFSSFVRTYHCTSDGGLDLSNSTISSACLIDLDQDVNGYMPRICVVDDKLIQCGETWFFLIYPSLCRPRTSICTVLCTRYPKAKILSKLMDE